MTRSKPNKRRLFKDTFKKLTWVRHVFSQTLETRYLRYEREKKIIIKSLITTNTLLIRNETPAMSFNNSISSCLYHEMKWGKCYRITYEYTIPPHKLHLSVVLYLASSADLFICATGHVHLSPLAYTYREAIADSRQTDLEPIRLCSRE